MIRFACPGCSATFTVGDEKAGKTGKCPKCQSQFIIPDAPVGASSPGSVASRPSLPPPPPPPPPPVDDGSNTVEVHPCPKCGSRLSVLATDVGLDIECPSCQTVYQAIRIDAPPPPPDTGSKSTSKLVKLGSGSKRDDDDDDDRPSKKKRRSRRDDDDDDDDEDDDDRPSRKRSRRSRRRSGGRSYTEHRGGMLLAFALIGMFAFFPLSIVAWVMANNDLQEMDAGRMDPEGRSMTHLAKILGIITVILVIVGVVGYCFFMVVFFGCFAAAAAGR